MALKYTDKGEGQTLVFIHGFCESSKIWSKFEEELSPIFRVICIDLPGHGSSPFRDESISIEWFAKEVKELLAYLCISRYTIIGHSLGGYVALAMAELFPQSTLRLVLFHSTSFPDSEEKKLGRDKTIGFIERNGLDTFMDSFVDPLFAEVNREKCREDIDFLISEGKNCDQNAVIETIKAMRDRRDRTAVLGAFSKPVLMIIGQDDIVIPIEDSLKQSGFSSTIETLVLNNCGHMGIFEKPTTCITRIKEFCLS
jgi:pimeloyl-ACP methyl ester carboxylesterase